MKSAGDEYKAIADRALTPPPNTAALMNLIDFMKKTQDFSLKDLEKRLIDVIDSIRFLSDYWHLTKLEITTNNTAFEWYHKIPKILEDYRQIIEIKTQEFQESLKGKLN